MLDMPDVIDIDIPVWWSGNGFALPHSIVAVAHWCRWLNCGPLIYYTHCWAARPYNKKKGVFLFRPQNHTCIFRAIITCKRMERTSSRYNWCFVSGLECKTPIQYSNSAVRRERINSYHKGERLLLELEASLLDAIRVGVVNVSYCCVLYIASFSGVGAWGFCVAMWSCFSLIVGFVHRSCGGYRKSKYRSCC